MKGLWIGVMMSMLLPSRSSWAASEEFHREQRAGGPLGGITLKVVDDRNTAVSDALVEVEFDNPKEKTVRRGTTDAQGLFHCDGRAIESVNYGVRKDGYYRTRNSYSFMRNAPSRDEPLRDGKWSPWKPTIEVTLKKIRKPASMYARRVDFIQIPLGSPIGFDFESGECVAPFGKGLVADIIFRVDRHKDGKSRRLPLAISFSNPMDGIQLLQRDAWSEFLTAYEAPETGYEKNYKQVDELFRDPSPWERKQWYYALRVRTKNGPDGRVSSARYAKIWAPIVVGGIEKEKPNLTFIYWYNPDGSRNVEFDTRKNLLKNLKSGESPPNP